MTASASQQRRRAGAKPGAERRCAVIGLAGGIGSGKSTVARMFGEMGVRVIDADRIVADVHQVPAVREAIAGRWGRSVFRPDGALDKRELARRVFDDPAELAALNRIIHPRVIERVEKEVAACLTPGGPTACVIDAPLLFESGLDRLCDVVVFVECPMDVRTRRLEESRRWAPEEIQRREAHQAPISGKQDKAEFVVRNGGGTVDTRNQVECIMARFKKEQ